MDIFKQSLAPIPQEAWEEINARAEDVIAAYLTTRKSLEVNGPFGLDKTSVSTGRLSLVEVKKSDNVKIGLYETKSLLETRINFHLSRWELDNVLRGAKDIDLEPLEEAVKEVVLFEENTIYNGNEEAQIKGLFNEAGHVFKLEDNSQVILDQVSDAIVALRQSFVAKPYNLIVGNKLYKALNKLHGNKLLRQLIEGMIGGEVILSDVVKGGLLLPVKHPDIEFTIGQEYTIGYETHDNNDIKLFIMNSYTLRVLDPQILVKFEF